MTESEQLDLLIETLERELNGDTTARPGAAQLSGRCARLYDGLIRLLDAQEKNAYAMQASAGKLMSVTEDLSATLEESENLSRELYENAGAVAALNENSFQTTESAIAEMNGLIRRIDETHASTREAQNANATAGTAIEGGIRQILNLIDLTGTVETTTKSTVERVDNFRNSANRISQILKNVNDIARQTEILSFNASIESKRAGVEGRGFGVIAGAIRDLANESKREVGNIEDVVDSISTGLHELTAMIYSDFENVKKSVESARSIELSLEHIRESYSGLSGLIQNIAAQTEEENALAQQVSLEFAAVEENSREGNSRFASLNAAIGHQKTMVEDLGRLGRFLQEATESLSRQIGQNIPQRADAERIRQLSQQIFALFENGALRQPAFARLTEADHRPILDSLLQNDQLEAIWTNDTRGRFIYSNPPAGILNARGRDWFANAAAGRPFVSEVYVSSITNRPCVTVAMPYRGADGRVLCVLGADLKL